MDYEAAFEKEHAVTLGLCGDNLMWRLEENILYIEGQGEMYDHRFLPWNNGILPHLKRVVIASGCTDICNYAFEYCAMEEIEIPATVKSIGTACFPEGKSHKRINVNPSNPRYASEDGFLIEKESQTLLWCPCGKKGRVTIPSGIISISDCACSICDEITEVEIPLGVEEIGEQAFFGCEKLEKVSLPEGLAIIDSSAFAQCEKLRTVHIPDSVKYIGIGAFYGCTNLTSLVIPDGVEKIEWDAFCGIPHIIYHGSAQSDDNWGALSRN